MNKQEVMKEIKDEMYLGFTTEYEDGYNKGLDTAITYIEKLIDPEEKPVVPQFIDTWIQGAKYNGFDLYEAMTDDEMSDKVATWIVCNPETFAKAWLFGYEVEKEKLYTAKLKSTGEYLHYDTETDKVYHFFAYGNVAKNSENYHFTEDTLLKYNAWGNDAYDVDEVKR